MTARKKKTSPFIVVFTCVLLYHKYILIPVINYSQVIWTFTINFFLQSLCLYKHRSLYVPIFYQLFDESFVMTLRLKYFVNLSGFIFTLVISFVFDVLRWVETDMSGTGHGMEFGDQMSPVFNQCISISATVIVNRLSACSVIPPKIGRCMFFVVL